MSNDALRGTTPLAAAQVMQWVSFADSEIVPPASAWVFPTLGIMQFNKQVGRDKTSAAFRLSGTEQMGLKSMH